MSLGEIEHLATMVSGCESLTSGGRITPDGKYSYAVLKLYSHAGNEGFLDTVKAAAGKIKEFFISLCEAIKDFLSFGRRRFERERKFWEEADKANEKLETDKEANRAKRYEMLKESMMHALTVAQGKMEPIKDSDDFFTFADYLELSVEKFRYLSSGHIVDDIIRHIETCKPEDFDRSEINWIKDKLNDYDTALFSLNLSCSNHAKRIRISDDNSQEARERDRQLNAGARLLKVYTEVYASLSKAFASFLKKDQERMEKAIN
ncbi:putative apolipophorin-III [Kosakonia phage Kc263]|uniref:Apolipophorin-III n=1 Tax=Kosakonia phage Kc263 TaxID=2863194 RepID=A0AAE7WF88_9CAUD|nr:putative apolipophorin-III [Kosakonia phage Kc263]QYN79998.1 putative apolipophorin-III [Kosakonia phage Kc263]